MLSLISKKEKQLANDMHDFFKTASEPKLTPNAVSVLEKRYLKKDETGAAIETPKHMFVRVADAIASAELKFDSSEHGQKMYSLMREKFYDIMVNLLFLPNSPTLMNAGRELGQLSACFVLPVGDSMESIFDAVKYTAMIHKSGGGTGFNFSNLRPSGDIVGSTKGVSSGPISFMTVFDTATEAVKQGGTRRGANMGMLRVDHPDIMEFIACKDNNAKFNNFNISVALTEQFMKAVENDEEYDLVNPRNRAVARRLKAREVFEKIVSQAWKNGEPGIVFLDRLNADNPTPQLGRIESTNPCGEQPLLPYESCNLGSINLGKMVVDGEIDWETLEYVTRIAVRFLDNVIEVNKYPLQQIDEMTRSNRKIGLGVMGWADMLVQLGLPYNSAEAVNLAEKIMGFIRTKGRDESCELAKVRGTFPNWKDSVWGMKDVPMRNATVTTIAPTGTLSILAGCSSGIEPLFAIAYVKNVMDGTRLIETNPLFMAEVKRRGINMHGVLEKIASTGSIHDIAEIPSDMQEVYVTAHDVTPMDHIKMQAAFQKYTDNAVSKTVNFPNSATQDDVREVYKLAYKLGCKGVTVYRDGSRENQVLTAGTAAPVAEAPEEKPKLLLQKRKRPSVISGRTKKMMTGCGGLYVTVNSVEKGHPFELFTNMGKAGGCAASQAEAIGRLVSLSLRVGVNPQEIVTELRGISCHQPSWGDSGRILSCADAIGKALEKAIIAETEEAAANTATSTADAEKAAPALSKVVMAIGACPDCGGAVEHESGCVVCRDCGFSKCG